MMSMHRARTSRPAARSQPVRVPKTRGPRTYRARPDPSEDQADRPHHRLRDQAVPRFLAMRQCRGRTGPNRPNQVHQVEQVHQDHQDHQVHQVHQVHQSYQSPSVTIACLRSHRRAEAVDVDDPQPINWLDRGCQSSSDLGLSLAAGQRAFDLRLERLDPERLLEHARARGHQRLDFISDRVAGHVRHLDVAALAQRTHPRRGAPGGSPRARTEFS
jgi:hypothetical protein